MINDLAEFRNFERDIIEEPCGNVVESRQLDLGDKLL
jgi:hypothetical protein